MIPDTDLYTRQVLNRSRSFLPIGKGNVACHAIEPILYLMRGWRDVDDFILRKVRTHAMTSVTSPTARMTREAQPRVIQRPAVCPDLRRQNRGDALTPFNTPSDRQAVGVNVPSAFSALSGTCGRDIAPLVHPTANAANSLERISRRIASNLTIAASSTPPGNRIAPSYE